MSDLIGTVYLTAEEIPEPEGWLGLWWAAGPREWNAEHYLSESREEALANASRGVSPSRVRAVSIGPRPEVPVEDIRILVNAAKADSSFIFGPQIEAIDSWLSSLEGVK